MKKSQLISFWPQAVASWKALDKRVFFFFHWVQNWVRGSTHSQTSHFCRVLESERCVKTSHITLDLSIKNPTPGVKNTPNIMSLFCFGQAKKNFCFVVRFLRRHCALVKRAVGHFISRPFSGKYTNCPSLHRTTIAAPANYFFSFTCFFSLFPGEWEMCFLCAKITRKHPTKGKFTLLSEDLCFSQGSVGCFREFCPEPMIENPTGAKMFQLE